MNDVQDNKSPGDLGSLGRSLPGQVVLVLQGGGALGSYQAGVYQALHEHRHIDRRHQCQSDRRQHAAKSPVAAKAILEADGTESDLEFS